MKKLMLLVTAAMILLSGTAWCSSGELTIFAWSEYMDEVNFPKEFEKATGIKVNLHFYESNEEMAAKLQANGIRLRIKPIRLRNRTTGTVIGYVARI